MFRSVLKRNKNGCYLAFFPFAFANKLDDPLEKPILLPGEIGFEKVKRIFERREDGHLTQELQSILSTTSTGIFVGMLLGGLIKTRNLKENFIHENQGTKFYSKLDAQKQMQQKLLFEFMKGGVPYAGKLGMFCFMFASVTTCYGAYTGKVQVRNYVLGGAAAGSMFRINMGIRGMLSGAFLGSMLGGMCGITSVALLYISGFKMDKIYEIQQRWVLAREEKSRQRMQQSSLESKNDTEELLNLLSQSSVSKIEETSLIPEKD